MANALIHADYYGRCGVVIDKKFREVTISNPGTFRISIDTAIAGGISDARNGRIFNMFSLIDVGERSGSGLCNIFHTWELNGYKKPSIVEGHDPDRITLTLQIEADGNRDGNDIVHDANDVNRDGNCDVNDVNRDANNSNLTVNELLVLNAIIGNPAISIIKIAESLTISKPTVERAIRSLKQKNLIQREGATRGKWIIP